MSIIENSVSFSDFRFAPKKEVRGLLVTSSSVYAEGLQLLITHYSKESEFSIDLCQNIPTQFLLDLHKQQELTHYLQRGDFGMILLSAQPNFEEAHQLGLALQQSWPGGLVIWLEVPDDPSKIISCIQTKAAGFFLETEKPDYLCQSLVQALRGEIVCSPKTLRHVFDGLTEHQSKISPASPTQSASQVVPRKLTHRELQVLESMVLGLSNRQISEQLTVEVRTVKNHVHNVLDKLQVSNRRDAVLKATHLQLLTKN